MTCDQYKEERRLSLFKNEDRDRLDYHQGMEVQQERRGRAIEKMVDLSLRFRFSSFDSMLLGLAVYLLDMVWTRGLIVASDTDEEVSLWLGACFVLAWRFEATIGDEGKRCCSVLQVRKSSEHNMVVRSSDIVLMPLQALGWPSRCCKPLIDKTNKVLEAASVQRGIFSLLRSHIFSFMNAYREEVPPLCWNACLYVGLCSQYNMNVLGRFKMGDVALVSCLLGCRMSDQSPSDVLLQRIRINTRSVKVFVRLWLRDRPCNASLDKIFPGYSRLSAKELLAKW